MDEITLGEKTYISSKRAAEITGYAKDYVGQLCREGHVDAKMVGRSWYVHEASIRAHRFGGDIVSQESEIRTKVMEEAKPGTPSADQSRAGGGNAMSAAGTEPESIAAAQPLQGWQNPVYTAETPQILPEMPVSAVPAPSTQPDEAFIAAVTAVQPAPVSPLPEQVASLTDMQTAWREWFDTRQTVPAEPAQSAATELPVAAISHPEPLVQAPIPVYPTDRDEVAVPVRRIAPEPTATYDAEDESDQEEEEDENDEEENAYDEEDTVTDEQSDEERIPIRRVLPVAPAPIQRPARAFSDHLVPQTTSAAARPSQPPPNVPAAEARITREVHLPQGRVIEERIVRRAGTPAARGKKSVRARTNAIVIAVLVAVCLLAISVAAVGTGIAEKYVHISGENNPIVQLLVGTRTYIRE